MKKIFLFLTFLLLFFNNIKAQCDKDLYENLVFEKYVCKKPLPFVFWNVRGVLFLK